MLKVGDKVTAQPEFWYDGQPVKGWPQKDYLGTIVDIKSFGGNKYAVVKHDSGRKDLENLDHLRKVSVAPSSNRMP